MATRLSAIVVDALDPVALGGFWAEVLGFDVIDEQVDLRVIGPPAGTPGLPIDFALVPEAKVRQNRVHLDLASSSLDHQSALVARLEDLGARHVDIGQQDVPWVVLADPEGNEFCVLEPRDEYLPCGPIAAVVIEASNPRRLAAFWAEATGWTRNLVEDDFANVQSPDGPAPFVEFIAATAPKQGKNRLHLDVAPGAGDDQAAEVERLLALGARHVDVGQPHGVSWVVLADPEGNELCVLTPR